MVEQNANPTEDQFGRPEAASAASPAPLLDDPNTIEPRVLTRGHFPDLSDLEFRVISPAVALAERVVMSPQSILFWHAMLFGRKIPIYDDLIGDTSRVTARCLPRYFYLANMPWQDRVEVEGLLQRLPRMVRKITFRDSKEKHGITAADEVPSGTTSIVQLHLDFLSHVMEAAIESSHEEFLATLADLAGLLTHELAHVIHGYLYGAWAGQIFASDTFTEAGFAFEKWIFGGKIWVCRFESRLPQDSSLSLLRLPSRLFYRPHKKESEPGSQGYLSYTEMPPDMDHNSEVPDEWTSEIFTNQFWDNEVPRTEGAVLRPLSAVRGPIKVVTGKYRSGGAWQAWRDEQLESNNGNQS